MRLWCVFIKTSSKCSLPQTRRDLHHHDGGSDRLFGLADRRQCQSDRCRSCQRAFTPFNRHMERTSRPRRHHQSLMFHRESYLLPTMPPNRPIRGLHCAFGRSPADLVPPPRPLRLRSAPEPSGRPPVAQREALGARNGPDRARTHDASVGRRCV